MPMMEGSYRTAPLLRFPLGRSHEVVYSPLQASGRLLSGQDVGLLCSCSRFLSLEGHAERAPSASEGASNPGTTDRLSRLKELAAIGLLIAGQDVLEKACQTARHEPREQISCIAIPTSGRRGWWSSAFLALAMERQQSAVTATRFCSKLSALLY